ncbi:uncharacterized protein LOC141651707 [Silene latifolia]|uniref:uncharacterized protein LOC141651707 n=1 Tax=Silene latifolia TaxID=37657 RepID=UPI003D78A82A
MGSMGFWNIRGMNSLNKQNEIRWFLHQNNIGLFGLLETKIKGSQWVKVRNNICEHWSTCTNSGCHPGGRVWLIWQPSMYQVDIQLVTDQCIHAHILDKSTLKEFGMTMVYGFNRSHERVSLWGSLLHCAATVTGPWIVCGDFNNVIEVNERIGGAAVSGSEMAPMREMMEQCQLTELKTVGSFYTWTNKHEIGSKVYSRLDRVLLNEEWLNVFTDSFANFLPEGLYDHCPCLISNYAMGVRKKAPFKYFNMWALAANFKEVVIAGWQINVQGTPMFQVVKKLQNLKKGLKQLDKESFSDIENLTLITELSLKQLQEQLRLDPLNDSYCEAKHAVAEDLKNLKKARDSS